MAESATTKKTLSLSKDVFDVEVNNHELLKLAYNAYLANGRENHAKTLRRGEVRGGGKKPWKQKGTGRARFGSSRNPIWRKGGVVFGPLGIENYSIKLSTNSKRVAIRQALTLANRSGDVVIIDELKTNGKTKDLVQFLSKQSLNEVKRVLIVVDNKDDMLVRSARNLPNVKLSQATYLNVYSLINADKVVVTKAALSAIDKWLGGTK